MRRLISFQMEPADLDSHPTKHEGGLEAHPLPTLCTTKLVFSKDLTWAKCCQPNAPNSTCRAGNKFLLGAVQTACFPFWGLPLPQHSWESTISSTNLGCLPVKAALLGWNTSSAAQRAQPSPITEQRRHASHTTSTVKKRHHLKLMYQKLTQIKGLSEKT